MVKVSVIIPVYNVEQYLEECLNSILGQTLRDIEVLCVNDGSTDGSLAILEQNAASDPRLQIITIPNGGAGAARNVGLKRAQGEYMIFFDGDDHMELNALQVLYDDAKAKGADIVVEGDPHLNSRTINGTLIREMESGQRVEYRAMAKRLIVAWSNRKIYRRSFLVDNSFKFSISSKVGENIFLRGNIFEGCVVSYVSGKLFYGESAVASHLWFYNALTALYVNISIGGCSDRDKRVFKNYAIELSRYYIDRIDDESQREEALELLYKLDRTHKFRDHEKIRPKDMEYYFSGEYIPWIYDAVMEHISTPRKTSVVVDPTKEGISVIIPVYNVEEYVELSVRSVMNQSYDGAIQIICINDGSTDSSLAILQRLAAEDSRIEIIDQPNAGQGSARNAGIKVARHERIMFLDSDDFWELDTFDLVATAFGYDTDLIVFSLRSFGENKSAYGYRIDKNGLYRLTDDLRKDLNVSVWNKVWRRSLIEKYNMEFPAIRHEDVPFATFYFVVSQSVYYFSDKQHCYRQRDDSTMGLSRKKNAPFVGDYLKSIDFLYDNLMANHIYGLGLAVFSKMFRMQGVAYFRNTNGRKQKDGIKLMQQMLKKYESAESLRSYNFDKYLDKIENGDMRVHKLFTYYLFQIIPIFTIKEYSDRTRYLLFGVLPIYKTKNSVKHTRPRVRYYLFGFLPIFKTKISSR